MHNTPLRIAAFVLVWLAITTALLATPRKITVREVVENGRASNCPRTQVIVEGVVTHARGNPADFFLQQNGVGIYVDNSPNASLSPGDRVRVTGAVDCSSRPYLQAKSLLKLGHGPLPAPLPSTYTELIQGNRDDALVSVRASIRSADRNTAADAIQRSATLHLQTDGGPADALVHCTDARSLESLLDAEVEITGIAGARQNSKLQRTGVVLYVGSLENIRVLRGAPADPWSLPATPLDKLLAVTNVRNLTQRVRVHGTVTYVEPGHALTLQEGAHSLWINSESQTRLRIGDEADAIGFPIQNENIQILTRAELRLSGHRTPLSPQPTTWQQLSSGEHLFDLVSLDGYLVLQASSPTEDRYVLQNGGELFGAIFRHNASSADKPARSLPPGAFVRLAGICVPASLNLESGNVPFNLLLRSCDDIQILKAPSPFNTRNLGISVLLLLFALALVSARFWRMERKVRREMATLAYSERRRSHILEQINGSVPLTDIIEQTTELVSFRLQGPPCWVTIASGARFGCQPAKLDGFRIVQHPIPSRSGPPLGYVFIGLDAHLPVRDAEQESLAIAADLLELAMETRKVLTDLVHRSEFDLLTEVQNRFSLERSLDAQILDARSSAGIFGLIYIDLNSFKQVNDLHGHQIGDLYLKEIALRMKRQLRPDDMLARLGGDEFAVLVPEVRSRSEVEEIALRLEHCFDAPFLLEGCTLQGSAAIGIAMYPEDARTRQTLLEAADSAMYGAKSRRGNSQDADRR